MSTQKLLQLQEAVLRDYAYRNGLKYKVVEIDSFAERLEKHQSWKDHAPHFIKKNQPYDPNDNVIAVLGTFKDDTLEYIKRWIFGHNIITNDGDIYYSQVSVQEAPAANEDFGRSAANQELRTTAATPAKTDTYTQVLGPITASRKDHDATYPKRNDPDTDNTGAGVDISSYRTSWTTSDFNDASIEGGTCHDNDTPVGATKLLNHYSFGAVFAKDADSTLKNFFNHQMNGT